MKNSQTDARRNRVCFALSASPLVRRRVWPVTPEAATKFPDHRSGPFPRRGRGSSEPQLLAAASDDLRGGTFFKVAIRSGPKPRGFPGASATPRRLLAALTRRFAAPSSAAMSLLPGHSGDSPPPLRGKFYGKFGRSLRSLSATSSSARAWSSTKGGSTPGSSFIAIGVTLAPRLTPQIS
jgi:hypothetical protein